MHRSGSVDKQLRDLIAENGELKKFHEQMRRELRSILCRHDLANSRVSVEDSVVVGKRAGAGRARSSRMVDQGFPGSLKKQWTSLKQLFESLEVQASQANVNHVISVTDHEKELTSMRKEMEELREELEKSRELISQQQELLQEQMLPKPGEGQVSPLWDAYFLEEQLRLQQDRAIFEDQKRAFQDEREKFTEAAIRLGRERLQFKADQALFVKQQFLTMTPGLETPSWKKTPPWSSAAPGTPRATSQIFKNFTPNWSRVSNSRRKRGDPVTPSTAELYRVLRLAPPSRSVLMSQRRERRYRKSDSDADESRSDSLSSMSESPGPRIRPPSAKPVKFSMTPYLCPRPTPLSVPRHHVDPDTPGSEDLYRVLGIASTGRASSKHRRREMKNSLREQLYEGTPSVFCQENSKTVMMACERTRTSCETDSLYSEDSPQFERVSSPRDDYKAVPTHAQCKASQVRTPKYSEEHHQCDEDTTHYSGIPQLYMTDHRDGVHFWLGNENSHGAIEICRNHSRDTFHPGEGYMEGLHLQHREELKENIPPEIDFTAQENELHYHKHGDRSSSRKNRQPRSSRTSRSRETLNQEHISRSRSRDTQPCRDCRSEYRRLSCHDKNSLSFSSHKRAAQHLRRSCPSNRDRGCCSKTFTTPHLRGDLLDQFVDCSM
ncbi:uncharacterized protein LOC134601474 [Pelobates fuscus]|uniref:uncharacterized protein LOC134601474 n=1 Tax=Pelobates fuscus TaxID=191477 RepID=UPI002FE4CBC4